MATLLVVDDDANLRILYEQELSDDGHTVTLAPSGSDALAKLEQAKFDVVILDIAMPEMDGLEVLERIMARTPHQPVILNTAYTDYQHNQRAWPASKYIVKSGDLTELKAAVHEMLELVRK